MAIEVDVPTIPERDELMQALEARGLSPKPVDADDHIGIEIPCDDADKEACDEVISQLESWLGESGLPLVLVKDDGHVYLRPPAP
jgi:hypothetical protein